MCGCLDPAFSSFRDSDGTAGRSRRDSDPGGSWVAESRPPAALPGVPGRARTRQVDGHPGSPAAPRQAARSRRCPAAAHRRPLRSSGLQEGGLWWPLVAIRRQSGAIMASQPDPFRDLLELRQAPRGFAAAPPAYGLRHAGPAGRCRRPQAGAATTLPALRVLLPLVRMPIGPAGWSGPGFVLMARSHPGHRPRAAPAAVRASLPRSLPLAGQTFKATALRASLGVPPSPPAVVAFETC